MQFCQTIDNRFDAMQHDVVVPSLRVLLKKQNSLNKCDIQQADDALSICSEDSASQIFSNF
jgi:hypothetical protein